MTSRLLVGRVLSTVATLWLIVGTLVGPMITQVGEVHGLSHAIGQSPHDGVRDEHHDAGTERSSLPHALMHQLDGCSSVGILVTDISMTFSDARPPPPVFRVVSHLMTRGAVMLRPPIG